MFIPLFYISNCSALHLINFVAILVPGVQVAKAQAPELIVVVPRETTSVGSLLLLGREQLITEIILSYIIRTQPARDTNASPYIDEQRCRGGVEQRDWSTSHCRQHVTPYYVRADKGR